MAFPLNWKNTIVLRTGAELAASSKLTLRAGYVYGSNPVPSTTVFPVFPAVVKHHVTAGASVKLSRSFRLNAAYEYAFRSNQKATANSYIAKEYNNSISSLENHIFHVSLSWLLK
jgi:long-chain fatty acid transport protein